MRSKDKIHRPQQFLARGILHRKDRYIRTLPQPFLHCCTLFLGKKREEDDSGEIYARLFDQAQENLRLQPVQLAPDDEHRTPLVKHLPRTHENALERLLLTSDHLLRLRRAPALCTDAAQPMRRLLRTARKRLGKVRRTEARMQLLCERDEHLLLLVRHRTAEHNE